MSRSKWKRPFVTKKNKVLKKNIEVTPRMIGNTFLLHNGLNFSEIEIKREMTGFKVGEFCSTRSRHIFKKKKLKKLNKN